MLAARVRLVLLWVSQVARVLADWGLRITAFLEVWRSGGEERESAFHLATAVFILPFILLAPFHGSISNGLPKRWVLAGSSLFCLAVVAAFTPTGGPWLWCLGVMALGSALYSPARYASLPAAAEDTHWPLTSVNGWFELGAAAAIVGGIILGLLVEGEAWPGVPRVILVLLGLNLVCFLACLPAHFPSDVRRPERPLQGLYGFFRDGRRIFADIEARSSLLGLAMFQGVILAGSGAVFTLALDNQSSGQTGAMLALIMVCAGAALGSGLAALQAHPRRSLGLIPLGVTGLVIAQAWAARTNVAGVTPALPSLLLGLTGSLINVPLRSAYLASVPADARGNAMSVMNTVVYLTSAAIALLMVVLITVGLLPTSETQLWFLVGVVAVGAVLAWRLLAVPALELSLEWLLWPMYRIRAHGPGARRLPTRGPLLLVANHSSYLDPFWIAKVVPRKLTPMMTSAFYDLPVIRWLMVHVVRAIRVETGKFRREAPELREAIEVLRSGGCVLIFPEAILRRKEEVLLRQFGQGVWHILKEVPETPVVVFWIEGGWGSFASYKGGPPMKNKGLDWWRRIDLAVTEPRPLDPAVLADHRTTRRYLMRVCLEARRYLGLEVPAEALSVEAEAVEAGEEEPRPAD